MTSSLAVSESANPIASVSRIAVSSRFAARRSVGKETSPASCRIRKQLGESDQVEGGACEYEEPVDLGQAAQLDLPHPRDRFQPPEGWFDTRAGVLTLRVASMSSGAPIDRAPARPREILRHVRGGLQLAHQVHEA